MERKSLLELPFNTLRLKYIEEESETGTRKYFAMTKFPDIDIWWNISKGWTLMKNTKGAYEQTGDIKDGTKIKAILWLKMQFVEHPSYMTNKLGSLEAELKDLLDKHYNMMGEFSHREITSKIPEATSASSAAPQVTGNVNLDMSETNALLKNLLENQMKVDEFKEETIKAIADKIISTKTETITQQIIDEADRAIKVKYGELPEIKNFILPEGKEKPTTGVFHRELENIMRLIQLDIPIMLTGPAGSGKNFTLEKAAEILDMDFYFTNAVTQEYKLTGFIDANGTYHETEFYKAFTNGGIFMLDEMDASIPEALVILNAAIANRYYDFPVGRIKAHENFRIVAAANTYGTGADMVYVGRNVLDGATLDRFTVIPFTYDERVEKSLCPDAGLYNFCTDLRKGINDRKLRYIISPRAMINSYKMLCDKDGEQPRFTKEYIAKVAIVKGMQKDDLSILKDDLPESEWKNALRAIIDEM